MRARAEALISLVEQATGKSIPRDRQLEGEDADLEILDLLDSIETESPSSEDADLEATLN